MNAKERKENKEIYFHMLKKDNEVLEKRYNEISEEVKVKDDVIMTLQNKLDYQIKLNNNLVAEQPKIKIDLCTLIIGVSTFLIILAVLILIKIMM